MFFLSFFFLLGLCACRVICWTSSQGSKGSRGPNADGSHSHKPRKGEKTKPSLSSSTFCFPFLNFSGSHALGSFLVTVSLWVCMSCCVCLCMYVVPCMRSCTFLLFLCARMCLWISMFCMYMKIHVFICMCVPLTLTLSLCVCACANVCVDFLLCMIHVFVHKTLLACVRMCVSFFIICTHMRVCFVSCTHGDITVGVQTSKIRPQVPTWIGVSFPPAFLRSFEGNTQSVCNGVTHVDFSRVHCLLSVVAM